MKSSFLLILFFGLLLVSTNYISANPTEERVILINTFPTINFDRPVDIQSTSSTPNLLYIAEQDGRVYSVNMSVISPEKNLILDISSKVDASGNEMGLLGLAFHPKFEENGYLFVDYTTANPRRTVISRYQVIQEQTVDQTSEIIILEVLQPYSNHNAGQIVFGPDDYLYITLGDGGSGGDPQNNGQDPSTLLGSILRIDVDQQNGSSYYAIPSDNPFVDNKEGFREEVYAYGLRNPWRMSFDSETGNLFTGDVGQNQIEEINHILKGQNYGWNIMEGTQCYLEENCDQNGLVSPILEYDHTLGNAVTGGYVYRGSNITKRVGSYFFGDYGSGRIWVADISNLVDVSYSLLENTNFLVSTFGVDTHGELYLADLGGQIYKFVQVIKDPQSESTSDISDTQNTKTTSNTFTSTNQLNYFSLAPFILIVFSLIFKKKRRKQHLNLDYHCSNK